MKNVFNLNDCNELVGRINKLEQTTQALWGKMAVGQMLAHCNVTYEMLYENNHPSTNAFVKLILSVFVKKSIVNEVSYKKIAAQLLSL